jgi:hypothetical protein
VNEHRERPRVGVSIEIRVGTRDIDARRERQITALKKLLERAAELQSERKANEDNDLAA